jgi:Haemolymph juvenile hormone binding protein (JHBP)
LNPLPSSGFREDPEGSKSEVQYTAPSFSLIGDYKANGQILVLPISGSGKANLTIINPVITYRCTSKAVEKDGEIYAEIVKFKYFYSSLDKLVMQFDDLFQTDQQLTENINGFLNENWKLIYEELKPKVFEVFGEITTQLINNVFAKRPYKEFFKQD